MVMKKETKRIMHFAGNDLTHILNRIFKLHKKTRKIWNSTPQITSIFI